MHSRVTIILTSFIAAWILWAQPRGLIAINDKVMIGSTPIGDWRYLDGFDTKQQCRERRAALIAEQDASIPTTDTGQDLSQLRYREYRCLPEAMHPDRLTRGVDD